MTPKARPAAILLTAVSLFFTAAALLTTARVHAAPVPLKTTELGRGPTVVFVPGLGSSRTDWLPTAKKLLGRYRVVLVDLPGQGESPLPDPFSFVTVGEALDGVLAKQNPESTIVVAHQIGGRATLAAFAAHPGRAKGVVLVDVPVGLPIAIDDQQKKQFLEFMEQNYEAVATRMFSNMGRDSTQSKTIYSMFKQTPVATVKAYLREGFFSDGNKDARALKVPAQLVITSRVWKAGMTPGSVLKTMGWEDTTAAAVRVPDAAYWVMKDQPDTLAAIISDFATARMAGKK